MYFIKAGDFIKIGTTSRWDGRLRYLRHAADMSELELLCTIPGAQSKLSRIQSPFEHLRIADDWFQISDEILEFARLARLKDVSAADDEED